MKKMIRLGFLCYVMICLTGCSNEIKNNPYFYDAEEVVLSANAEFYELETVEKKEIKIDVYLVKTYEQGKLYKFAIEPIGYLEAERTNIYLYVTSEKIYRLWSYIYQDKGIIEFYDDDELIIKWLDTDQKLMENGEVVCQFEEMSEENEDGIKSISLLTNNKVRYTRYNKKANGETGFYEWFTWEQDKGLVEYGSGFGAGGEILYLTQIKELIDA